ncbi:hypothetical protein LOTGIDRAFT_185823 [Lottia gigantea]|uniref:IQ calmodulin-binding motif-containing protein 1 n=1 Tax=Lottia gigantea TaxID=225164 RepID=V4AG79_LOTGI|nr:hypothetical protein LOTGIDRAFT_185823 [Lottia gigantea]ESP03049.1 hypothetical protein LOTGIDRAFT_185823 [Lottia gigantea]
MTSPGVTPRSFRKDQRIINLSKEILEAKDRRVPVLLLDLKDILNSSESTKDTVRIKRELWEYNIHQVVILVLRQDYSVITGEWSTAANIAKLLSVICTGIDIKGPGSSEFYNELLPKACENLFLLSRHIQAQIAHVEDTIKGEEEEKKLFDNFQTVMDSLAFLVSAHSQLCKQVYSSPWLLQLLISDDPDTVVIVMTLLTKIFRINGYILNKLDDSIIFNIMDELIYKLTVNNVIEVAAIATKCVLKICDYHRGVVGSLTARYKGLKALLGKWAGEGFDRDLRHLHTLLETGSVHRAENEKFFDAAVMIQMMWRGFVTRKKLRKANNAFSNFQKSYRLRKKEVTMKQEEKKLAQQFERQLKENRLKIMREFHQRQLHTIEILPAAKVDEYLAKEKSVAALKIQTLWRGKKERDLLPWRQEVQMQVKAAIKIQRTVRKWLDKLADKNKNISISLKPPGLTDARRLELRSKIQEWRDLHPTHIDNRESLQEIHNRAAQLLANHYSGIKPQRQQQQHIDALIARLDTDSDLVLLAPKLKDITEKDAEMYTSRSVPIATKARVNHLETLRKIKLPWWKRLDEEDDMDLKSEYQDTDEFVF